MRGRKKIVLLNGLADRYASGDFTLADVALAAGISIPGARDALARQGVAIRAAGPKRFVLPPRAIRDYESRRSSSTDLAVEFGVAQPTICAALRRQGVPIHGMGPSCRSRRGRALLEGRRCGFARRAERIWLLIDAGASRAQVAGHLGVSVQRVQQILAKFVRERNGKVREA